MLYTSSHDSFFCYWKCARLDLCHLCQFSILVTVPYSISISILFNSTPSLVFLGPEKSRPMDSSHPKSMLNLEFLSRANYSALLWPKSKDGDTGSQGVAQTCNEYYQSSEGRVHLKPSQYLNIKNSKF